MMKTVFLIGNETPMDLLLLSLFLRKSPPVDLIVGIKLDKSLNWRNVAKAWDVFKKSGMWFVGFHILLNSNKGRIFLKNNNIIPADIGVLKKQYKFPLFYFDDVNSPKTFSIINSFSPDVIFNHMPQRIRYPLIKLPPLGIVNIHPGLLPEYQGMGSCLWPLIEGSHFHGLTLHYIDSQAIDTGPIIASGRFMIKEKDSVLSLHIKSRIISAIMLSYITNRFCRNEEVKAKTQIGGRYHKLPEKKHLKVMFKRKYKYISLNDRKIISENKIIHFELSDETTGWEWKPRDLIQNMKEEYLYCKESLKLAQAK